jgi:thioredoxin-dependent peroxiredoxin
MSIPTAGSPAPDFTLAADDGSEVTLSDLRGRHVVIFFYPKDDTPGCVKEACSFRDALPRFADIDAEIFGISPDSVESHAKFRKKYSLPYRLLADVDHEVAEKYGVWGQKSFMGVRYWGNARTTFVVAPDGTIHRVFEKVKPEGHAEEVRAAIIDG